MKKSLRSRLLAAFVAIVATLSVTGLLLYQHSRNITRTYHEGMAGLLTVSELSRVVEQAGGALARLVSVSPEVGEAEYRSLKARIKELRQALPAATANPASPRLVQDLDSMADSFTVEAGAAIYALRAGDIYGYATHYREALTIAGYVREAADRLMASELAEYERLYPEVLARLQSLQRLNLTMLVMVSLSGLLFAWGFAEQVSRPLRSLARAAGRIASGDLAGPPVAVHSGDELEILGRSFNHMQENLRSLVGEMQEKARLERELQAATLKNLEVRNLLQESELRALQSQVNPHFLFNTLNMVARTALIEEAERTRELLETVADLLRYNLRQLDRPATLADEVEQVNRYITIQKARFRERLQFVLQVDDAALQTRLPAITLQPLVENAVIHGIGNQEQGGTIALTIRQTPAEITVVVQDTGRGMTPEQIATAMGLPETEGQAVATPRQEKGHTTGLGLTNVRRRLELFYGRANLLSIESTPGHGTAVILHLPAEGG